MLIIIQDGNSVTLMTINYSTFPVHINHCHPSLHMENQYLKLEWKYQKIILPLKCHKPSSREAASLG